MKRIHIFKTGTHTDSTGQTLTFSEADLTKAVAAYDPALHQAPIVVGHPKTDAPAFGWVSALNSDRGNLFAVPDQVNTEFSEQVAQGSYKKVSASFYPPNSPSNPVKGSYYLRHVGFLGAEPPAIKGLQPVEFSEGDAVTITVDFSEADNTTSEPNQTMFEQFVGGLRTLFFGEDASAPTADTTTVKADTDANPAEADSTATPVKADTPKPDIPINPNHITDPINDPTKTDDNAMTTQTTDTAKDTKIAELQAQLDAKEAAEAKSQTEAAQKENADFSESLVNDGKIAPKDKELVTAILNGIDTAHGLQPVEFGEGDGKKSLKDAIKDKLENANTDSFAHLFSEAASKPTQSISGNFEAPSGTTIDADRLALHQQALTYSEAHKVDYATAVIAIGG